MPRNLGMKKGTALLLASGMAGILLLLPALSSVSIQSNHTGSLTKESADKDPMSDIMPVGMNMNMDKHYSVISQTTMDSFIQKAYATGTFRHFTLVASEGATALPTGDKIGVFSFNGTIPAPTLRVNQGDTVQVTVINPPQNGDIHSIDFHGSQLSAVPNFSAVPPGSNRTLTFVAVNPGVWIYHCEANNIFELWEHPMKGMAGMLIVDPREGYTGFDTNSGINGHNMHVKPLAREFSLVYGEIYAADDTESMPVSTTPTVGASINAHDLDQAKMFHEIPTYAVVNGVPFGYIGPLVTLPPWNEKNLRDVINTDFLLDNPNPPLSALVTPDGNGHTAATHLNVKTGEHVRFFIQNVGDKAVAWHIVGEQLDRVSVGGSVVAQRVQTWEIPAYGDATIDVVFEQPGVYAAVNHDYSMLFKGQAIIIKVSDQDGPNPSNAVPPHTKGASIMQEVCSYGIGPDRTISPDDDQFKSRCGI